MVNEQQKCTIHKNALKFLFPPFLTNPPHPKQARQTYGALQTSMVFVVHCGDGGAPIPMQLLTNCARNSTHQQMGPMVHCANSCCISQTMSYGYEWKFMCSQWRPVRPPHAALHSVPRALAQRVRHSGCIRSIGSFLVARKLWQILNPLAKTYREIHLPCPVYRLHQTASRAHFACCFAPADPSMSSCPRSTTPRPSELFTTGKMIFHFRTNARTHRWSALCPDAHPGGWQNSTVRPG